MFSVTPAGRARAPFAEADERASEERRRVQTQLTAGRESGACGHFAALDRRRRRRRCPSAPQRPPCHPQSRSSTKLRERDRASPARGASCRVARGGGSAAASADFIGRADQFTGRSAHKSAPLGAAAAEIWPDARPDETAASRFGQASERQNGRVNESACHGPSRRPFWLVNVALLLGKRRRWPKRKQAALSGGRGPRTASVASGLNKLTPGSRDLGSVLGMNGIEQKGLQARARHGPKIGLSVLGGRGGGGAMSEPIWPPSSSGQPLEKAGHLADLVCGVNWIWPRDSGAASPKRACERRNQILWPTPLSAS